MVARAQNKAQCVRAPRAGGLWLGVATPHGWAWAKGQEPFWFRSPEFRDSDQTPQLAVGDVLGQGKGAVGSSLREAGEELAEC